MDMYTYDWIIILSRVTHLLAQQRCISHVTQIKICVTWSNKYVVTLNELFHLILCTSAVQVYMKHTWMHVNESCHTGTCTAAVQKSFLRVLPRANAFTNSATNNYDHYVFLWHPRRWFKGCCMRQHIDELFDSWQHPWTLRPRFKI